MQQAELLQEIQSTINSRRLGDPPIGVKACDEVVSLHRLTGGYEKFEYALARPGHALASRLGAIRRRGDVATDLVL